MKTFDFAPYGDVKRTIKYLDRTIDFETGTFQVQRIGVNPIITFEATYQGTAKRISEIEDFYNEHRKSERFYFIYNKEQYTCQFTSDFASTDSFGYVRGETGNIRVIVKKQVTLTMRVCNDLNVTIVDENNNPTSTKVNIISKKMITDLYEGDNQ